MLIVVKYSKYTRNNTSEGASDQPSEFDFQSGAYLGGVHGVRTPH